MGDVRQQCRLCCDIEDIDLNIFSLDLLIIPTFNAMFIEKLSFLSTFLIKRPLASLIVSNIFYDMIITVVLSTPSSAC